MTSLVDDCTADRSIAAFSHVELSSFLSAELGISHIMQARLLASSVSERNAISVQTDIADAYCISSHKCSQQAAVQDVTPRMAVECLPYRIGRCRT
jgi:hypothetical protein